VEPSIAFVAAAAGYCIGAFSFTRLIARIVAPGTDLSHTTYVAKGGQQTLEVTSVNATALALRAGSKVGLATGLLDMLKIFVPTLAFRLLYPQEPYFLIVAVAGMVGHIWPVYYRFKGGRGISAVYGGLLAIDPLGAVVTAVIGPVLGMLIRDAYMTFAGGMLLLIPWFWLRTHDVRYVAYAVALNAIFLLASMPEIREYLRIRREGREAPAYEEMLQTTPMGKGLFRMGVFLHLIREKPR
jgi:glycerol-3-phosphate acyltransferase PlsY